MMSALLSRCLILVLGTLYPAYRSYKAIKNKDVREHVKWMMYWIVFALFTTLETFLDIFFSWFPFYYEIKILFILWVLSPATRGSSLLYKNVVHPMLISREKEIDELIEKTKQQGYTTFLQVFSSGFQYASNLFVNSALRGQLLLGNQLKKSLSMNDVYNGSSQSQFGNAPIDNGYKQGKSNLYRKPDTINEDDEDTDYEQEELNRISSNGRHMNNLIDDEDHVTIKPTRTKTTVRSNSVKDYEIIDDNIQINGNENLSKPKQTATNITHTGTRRRASSKQLGTTSSSSISSSSTSSYKSTEASHFGTITRGKVAKARVASATSLHAQTIYDNDS